MTLLEHSWIVALAHLADFEQKHISEGTLTKGKKEYIEKRRAELEGKIKDLHEPPKKRRIKKSNIER